MDQFVGNFYSQLNKKIEIIDVIQAKERVELIKSILEEMTNKYQVFLKASNEINLYRGDDLSKLSQLRYNLDQTEDDLSKIFLKLAEYDCVVKDPLSGLIDFIGFRKGEHVWLCFKLGETELKYYHSWNGGFIGRQIIDFE